MIEKIEYIKLGNDNEFTARFATRTEAFAFRRKINNWLKKHSGSKWYFKPFMRSIDGGCFGSYVAVFWFIEA